MLIPLAEFELDSLGYDKIKVVLADLDIGVGHISSAGGMNLDKIFLYTPIGPV
jgi:hypothetical protein